MARTSCCLSQGSENSCRRLVRVRLTAPSGEKYDPWQTVRAAGIGAAGGTWIQSSKYIARMSGPGARQILGKAREGLGYLGTAFFLNVNAGMRGEQLAKQTFVDVLTEKFGGKWLGAAEGGDKLIEEVAEATISVAGDTYKGLTLETTDGGSISYFPELDGGTIRGEVLSAESEP